MIELVNWLVLLRTFVVTVRLNLHYPSSYPASCACLGAF